MSNPVSIHYSRLNHVILILTFLKNTTAPAFPTSITMGVCRYFPGDNVDILLILFRLLTMQCIWTFTKRFTLFTPQRKCSIFRQQSQKLRFVDAAVLLIHSYFLSHSIKLRGLPLTVLPAQMPASGLPSLNRTFKLEKLQKSARVFSSQAKFKARNKKMQL